DGLLGGEGAGAAVGELQEEEGRALGHREEEEGRRREEEGRGEHQGHLRPRQAVHRRVLGPGQGAGAT
uniref:Uncharacterized protein n=1 Tax=Triticum urartu TaxID=4572 RepID=A0A8R7UV91_TRIUA